MSNPLRGKICMTLMSSGVGGPDGGHPLCMLGRCAYYSRCMIEALSARKAIRELNKRKWWEVWK